MGCISSKAIARSMSIREELNHGFQSRSAAWEELLTSHSGNDQLFALVCSANTMTTKLRASSFTLPSRDPDTAPETKYLDNAWDLIPDINGKTEVKSALDALGEPDFGRFTRSKSCQILGERDMIGLAPETGGLNENKLDWKDKNLTGSRSFHTVEEYDALLERIHKFRTRSMDSFEDYYSQDKSLQISSSDGDQNDNCIKRTTDCLKKETVIEADRVLDREAPSSLRNFDDFKNAVRVDGTHETGWKRKAIAKGLKSLDVPTIDFPAVARLRQRIQAEGQVYSPGTYITPKFGSYNAKVTPVTHKEEGGEKSVFSPELVAAFENCMQQLQEEEDSILSHMEGHLPVGDKIENEVKEVLQT
ncbi:UNVERIFIED_CONTAM: hypothetical protein Slati_2031700 [Sesamum latifolium]|uniref:Uncharacterized protein n=1 Tax=Sesamum latifolium TaxID=2727402 RepID=A0AAW2WNW6_9LAMI